MVEDPQIARDDTRCRHMGYFFRLAARVLLYALSHRQDNTYDFLCYTRRGALAGTRNSSMDRSDDPSHHERTLLPQSYISLPTININSFVSLNKYFKINQFLLMSSTTRLYPDLGKQATIIYHISLKVAGLFLPLSPDI